MTGVSFQIEIDDASLRGVLAGLAAAAEDMTPAFDAIGDMLVAGTIDRFERGIGPDGVPWVPSQRASATGGKTLVERGYLVGSLVHEAGPDYVAVGTNLIYAAIHQLGGQTGRGHAVTLPARPYLGASADEQREAVDILKDHYGRAAGVAP